MGYESEKLIKAIELFRSKHRKILLPDRKLVIKEHYKLLMEEYVGSIDLLFQETAESVDIKISTDSILTCNDGSSSLNFLIGTANVSRIYALNNQVIFELWFRCWEWIDKS